MNYLDTIFSENTLLDRIVSDLQPIINEYIKAVNPLFVIGKYKSSYHNYRSVTINDIECKKILIILKKYYEQYNGFPAIDSFDGNILCCDNDFSLTYACYYVRCTNENFFESDFRSIKMGDNVLFKISFGEIDFEHITYYSLDIPNDIRRIGLYVRSDVSIKNE